MKRLIVALILITTCVHTPDTLKMDMQWPNPPIFWSYSVNMDPVTILLVRESFEYWNLKLGRMILIEIQPDDYFNPHFPANVTVYQVDALAEPPGLEEFVQTVAATADNRTNITIFSPFDGLNLNAQRTALRHEVGHILGMGHSDNNDCLMWRNVSADDNKPREVCDAELALLRRTYLHN